MGVARWPASDAGRLPVGVAAGLRAVHLGGRSEVRDAARVCERRGEERQAVRSVAALVMGEARVECVATAFGWPTQVRATPGLSFRAEVGTDRGVEIATYPSHEGAMDAWCPR